MPKQYPVCSKLYSFKAILQLDLDDRPKLLFVHKGEKGVIQKAHVTDEELLSVPSFADTRWMYYKTTQERIPIFMYVGSNPITNYVTLETPTLESYNDDKYWACPIGFYREQYKEES